MCKKPHHLLYLLYIKVFKRQIIMLIRGFKIVSLILEYVSLKGFILTYQQVTGRTLDRCLVSASSLVRLPSNQKPIPSPIIPKYTSNFFFASTSPYYHRSIFNNRQIENHKLRIQSAIFKNESLAQKLVDIAFIKRPKLLRALEGKVKRIISNNS
jgi:hypothetical protein